MIDNITSSLLELLITMPAVLIALVIHELSHAYVSYAFGDPTPKQTGRLSLNPLNHLDPIGTILLLLFHVGWAKPVMINPSYYKKPRLGIALVSLAGPLSNFILAILAILFFSLATKNGWMIIQNFYLQLFLLNFIYVNVGLGVLNLIPIPPLDGSKILGSFLSPENYNSFMSFERFGFLVLLPIIFLGGNLFTEIINQIVNFFMNIFL